MLQKRSLIAVVLAALLLPLSAIVAVRAATGPGGPKLHLHVGSFDPAASTPTVKNVGAVPASAPAFSTPRRPALWIVQAKRPEGQALVTEAVKASGATLLGYLPDQAYAVYATPEQRVAFVTQAGALIHFAGPFQPAWRVRKAVAEASGIQTVAVHFFHRLNAEQKAAGFAAVVGVPGVRVLRGKAGDPSVTVTVDAARVGALTAAPEVEWVNTPARFKLHNATARWVNDTGARDTLHLTKPVGGLTGAGQVAAVADTGINYIPDVNGDAQAYFSDCAPTCKVADYTLVTPGLDAIATTFNNTGHRKMAGYFDLGNSGARPADDAAHGTHVAGSVSGNIAPHGAINEADGMAWAGRLIHQNIADADGALGGIPTNIYELFQLAYRPADMEDVGDHDVTDFAEYDPLIEARTHNNSWGGDPVAFAETATQLDQFVWDHEDMAIVVSAGNDGTNPQTAGTLGTVGAPATAKNDLTSGASANGDQPQVSVESMASFSSHGPTADGRYGPDLVTPGQIVISPKGSSANDKHYMQGTSMSAPILTGLSTLVRQYFWDGYGPALTPGKGAEGVATGTPATVRRFNPSAALVKAVMVNGAKRMRGFYTGDDGNSRDEDGQYPSAGQGFGLVNLDNSLYLPNDPTSLWIKDVWRDTNNGAMVDPSNPAAPNPEAFPGPSIQAAQRSYTLNVAAGQPLEVTLAWTDAPNLVPGSPSATSLVNNLDLVVTAPDGKVYRGNNFNTETTPKAADHMSLEGGSADTKNNVEKVRLPAPVAGAYTVQVSAPTINSAEAQGFALAATGAVSVPATTPTLGSGWRTDPTPNAAPAVLSTSVDHSSNDVAIVQVATNEPTKAVVRTPLGGVFRSVDTVGADGFPNLPSAFTEEIPDNTGFPPAAGAHDVVATRHRILVTGPRSADTTMTVDVTDLSGRTASVFLGQLFATPGVYQPPLDDIAQLAAEDAAYGGFNSNSTQLYVGSLTGLGKLLGTYKFGVPASYDTAAIGGAVVESSSGHDLTKHDADDWRMRTELLPNTVEANWRQNTFDTIHTAAATARLNPTASLRRGGNAVYAQAVTCANLSEFRSNLADDNAAFRMEADTPHADSAMSFEPGANRRSRGPHLRPKLVLYKQQPDGTLLDPRPCDPNAPAPVLSDVRVARVADTNATTHRALISWTTDVPSDSTVLIRPRGSAAGSWVEVAVPGRTTAHQVEVRNLAVATDYEFIVHSASCNGAGTTATNGGAGYSVTARSTTPYNQLRRDDFDDGNDDWTPAVVAGSGPSSSTWARKTDRKTSGTHSFAVAPYNNNTNTTLTSPVFNTAAGKLRIAWNQLLDTEPDFDFLYVEVNTGAGWVEVAKFSGQSRRADVGVFDREEIEASVPASTNVQVRFRFQADDLFATVDGGYDGVWVDDVTLSQGGPALPSAAYPVKALSAASAVTAPAIPLRANPAAADILGGTARCAPVTTTPYAPPPPAPQHGYWLTAADAGLFSFGSAKFLGSRGGQLLNQPVVAMTAKADHTGYWQVAQDGGVFTYGNAQFHGSMGGTPLNKPVVGMAAMPDGSGYWLVASDGGIFAFGSAPFHGSMGGTPLNRPIVGMAALPDGSGYWMVASDGGIFSFGRATFKGSMGGVPLAGPIVGMEPTPSGDGYWMAGRDGAVFAFGGAAGRHYGSMAGRVNDIVGIAARNTADGYWLVGANGGVYPFGAAEPFGSMAGTRLVSPVVGVEGF